MIEIFYTTPDERKAAVVLQEALGHIMKHDDHNVGPNGEHRLEFAEVEWRVPQEKSLEQLAAVTDAADSLVTDIDAAFLARTTALTASEKTSMRDKIVKVISKAQGNT